MRVSRLFSYPLALSAFAFAAQASAQTAVDSTKKDSTMVATTVADEQAQRGIMVFTKTCVACHTKEDLSGNDFKTKWSTRPVFDLFELIHTTMPDDAPGTLTRDQYIDVTTYLLRLNGAPPGGMPINHADTTGMRKMKIEIVVPAVNLDGILKTDTTKSNSDISKARSEMIASHRRR